MKWTVVVLAIAGCSSSVIPGSADMSGPTTTVTNPSGDSAADLTVVSARDLASGDLTLSAATFGEITNFGSNPGELKMYAFVPAGAPANAALVVALPGCGMSAADYVNVGWNELATLSGFYVVYAEQQVANNSLRCFNWPLAPDSTRDSGEAFSIKQMADYMKSQYAIDPHRVFVTGLSGGGGMATVMLADYPEVFSAGAIMSGLPYHCATDVLSSFSCAAGTTTHTPKDWGDFVRAAYPGYSGTYPRVSIWQGQSDTLVGPQNMTEIMKQWTNANGIDITADVTEQVSGATHAEYRDSAGNTLVETYSIPNMAHGTAVQPGYQPAGGCGMAGAFILDAGICSTYYAAKFFGL